MKIENEFLDYDQVVLASHADQSLKLLEDPSLQENNICLELDADSFFSDMNGDGVMDVIQWHRGTDVPKLQDWMYEAGVTTSAFENKSGFINIWYGNEE